MSKKKKMFTTRRYLIQKNYYCHADGFTITSYIFADKMHNALYCKSFHFGSRRYINI